MRCRNHKATNRYLRDILVKGMGLRKQDKRRKILNPTLLGHTHVPHRGVTHGVGQTYSRMHYGATKITASSVSRTSVGRHRFHSGGRHHRPFSPHSPYRPLSVSLSQLRREQSHFSFLRPLLSSLSLVTGIFGERGDGDCLCPTPG